MNGLFIAMDRVRAHVQAAARSVAKILVVTAAQVCVKGPVLMPVMVSVPSVVRATATVIARALVLPAATLHALECAPSYAFSDYTLLSETEMGL